MARTRAADFEEKQRVILDHAARVFAEQGMEKASMSQIATVAQVSKALLYHYYPNKDALIFAIIMGHLEELDQVIDATDDPTLPPQTRLRNLVGAVLDTYRGPTISTRCSLTRHRPCQMTRRPQSPRSNGASSAGLPLC